MKDPEALEHDVESLRGYLGGILHELDHRRHELFDWRLQASRHRSSILSTLGTLFIGVAGSIVLAIWRQRHNGRVRVRAHHLWQAAVRVFRHPEEVARSRPTFTKKILGAAAGAVVSLVAKRVARGALPGGDQEPAR